MKLFFSEIVKFTASVFFCFIFSWQAFAAEPLILATVEFNEIEADVKQKIKQKAKESKSKKAKIKKSSMYQRIKKKGNWYEINGYLNRKYVYLIVKKTGNNHIEGYLYDGKGNKRFVYGEWFRQQLQVYDTDRQRFTVILNE